ncbi:transposase [Candidatus Bathyarchaeota archaeon]|nr:transposase [Candidatus Bathyarchaeota archaeon]
MNRNRSQYRCRECGFEVHADLNAARNIYTWSTFFSFLRKKPLITTFNPPLS